jgi:hypothetical protein
MSDKQKQQAQEIRVELAALWELVKPRDESGDVMPPINELLRTAVEAIKDQREDNKHTRKSSHAFYAQYEDVLDRIAGLFDSKVKLTQGPPYDLMPGVIKEVIDGKKSYEQANKKLREYNHKLLAIFKQWEVTLERHLKINAHAMKGDQINLVEDAESLLIRLEVENKYLNHLLYSIAHEFIPPAQEVTDEEPYDLLKIRLAELLNADRTKDSDLVDGAMTELGGSSYPNRNKLPTYVRRIVRRKNELHQKNTEQAAKIHEVQRELEAQIQLNGDLDRQLDVFKRSNTPLVLKKIASILMLDESVTVGQIPEYVQRTVRQLLDAGIREKKLNEAIAALKRSNLKLQHENRTSRDQVYPEPGINNDKYFTTLAIDLELVEKMFNSGIPLKKAMRISQLI